MSAASEEIREFLRRLNVVRPNAADPTFLDKIEALLTERDELLATLKVADQTADHANDCTVYDASESDDGCDCHCRAITAAIAKAEAK